MVISSDVTGTGGRGMPAAGRHTVTGRNCRSNTTEVAAQPPEGMIRLVSPCAVEKANLTQAKPTRG